MTIVRAGDVGSRSLLIDRTRRSSGLGKFLAVVGLIAGFSGSACSAAPVDRGTVVGVQLRDFHVGVARSSVPAGIVTFRVQNDGPSTHEFNVDQTSLAPKKLPLKKDGMAVNEDSTQLKRIASIEEVFDRHTDNLTVTLAKGHYVLYCNMEGHYSGNMRASIDVR